MGEIYCEACKMILFIACLLLGSVMVVEAWQELTCW